MDEGIIRQLTWYQIIVLKNLYDQGYWPNKIGIVDGSNDLIVEYEQPSVGINGMHTSLETVRIEHKKMF